MNNKLPYIIGGSILLLLIALLFTNTQNSPQQRTQRSNLNPTQSISGQVTTAQSPQDVVPGLYKNEIQNTSTKVGFKLQSITVENNTDETGKTVGDHLELTLKNIAGKDLTDFEVYYTISDPTTKKKEGYYKKLTGFVLKSGVTQKVNFDNKQGEGHFTANKNSIYYTSSNKLLFDVMVSTTGYKIDTVQSTKDAGGAEVKD